MHVQKENNLILVLELPLTRRVIPSSLCPSLSQFPSVKCDSGTQSLSSVHLDQLLGSVTLSQGSQLGFGCSPVLGGVNY